MDLTQPLIEQRRADTFGPEPDRCLDCGSPPAGSRPIELSLYPGRWLRRCKRCGVRYALDHTGVWRLFHCLGCGLPLLTDDVSSGAARRCGDCRSASNGATPTDGDVARATEREVRAALRAEWRFVG
ncbi:MAG TPA: hypothetical protein VD788_05550, partial [Candidatus Polarisedimenticolaceae bacterium]|nr:hypothetical protein [Candidatus Polarisedimenticolaceae bacterium]